MQTLSKTQNRIMLAGLMLCAVGWGISFFVAMNPWSDAVQKLYWMGADEIAYQPLLGYWLKMSAAVFGCIGIASALAFHRPDRYQSLIRLLAPFHLFIGFVLIWAAWENQLVPTRHRAYRWDIGFCFAVATLVGGPLLFARPEVESTKE